MKKYVALLRGINVGGNNKVEMKRLKAVFESLGHTKVVTYINSGNVIFETNEADTAPIIEKAIAKEFGFLVRVVVRTAKNIQAIIAKVPKDWINGDGQKTDVLFFWDEFDNKESINHLKATKVDTLIYVKGAIIWHIAVKDYGKSAIPKFIGTPLYKHMTARNINTVRKLAELMQIETSK